MRDEYRDVIVFLKKGYSIRDVAKLTGRGVSTVQRSRPFLLIEFKSQTALFLDLFFHV